MTITWTPRARKHLLAISAYIARDNPAAARQMVDRIRDAVTNLTAFPAMGRVGRIGGTRELVISGTSYIVVYRFRARSLRVLAILHTSQSWPEKR